jgi:L-lactate dehydrogenase
MSPTETNSERRYAAADLVDFATTLLSRAGLPDAPPDHRARRVAQTLVEADLMGHSTHGLALLAPYLKELEAGTMETAGDPEVLADRGSAVTWNGRYLPGPCLVHRAIDLAFDRIADHPLVTIAIQRSHHIACLATYLERATERGMMLLLACSDPRCATVAPHGGLRPVYSPNPIAVGIPTAKSDADGEPILIDISTSVTANNAIGQHHREGSRLPARWLLTSGGEPTDDPAAFFAYPPATVLPLGGLDAGYKGFALGLLVEALTCALTGHGRADDPKRWTNNVLIQLIDPAAFGGRDAFLRETGHLSAACAASPPRDPAHPVRLPGARALALRTDRLRNGIPLPASILTALRECSDKCAVPFG